jgi:succinate dehydrogenase / fumarate reductase cytochrome b subunit
MSHTEEIHNKRPTSPHLSIYKTQISSVMSIFHRLTGIGLFIGFAMLSWWMIFWVFSKFDHDIFNWINCIFVRMGLYCLVMAFFYHLCNGIRHLFWDIGMGYSISAMHKSGWLVVFATILLTTIFCFITI